MSDFLETYKKTHTHPINRLTHSFGIPMVAVSSLWGLVDLITWPVNQWKIWLLIWSIGWTLQFIGHAYEGKPPAFFSNPLYLFIGVWWWLLKTLGIKK